MLQSDMDRHLPGGPSKLLVRRVRGHLKLYAGITPRNDLWRLTWEWARTIQDSYMCLTGVVSKSLERRYERARWPSAREIATQYVVLLLAQLQSHGDLKLPFRANRMPDSVRKLLPTIPAAKGTKTLPVAALAITHDEGTEESEDTDAQ